jgi:hypothetical protein
MKRDPATLIGSMIGYILSALLFGVMIWTTIPTIMLAFY